MMLDYWYRVHLVAGCKSAMSYDVVGKKITLQLPNAGMDGIPIVWGIRFCIKVLDVMKEMKSAEKDLLQSCIRAKIELLNTILQDTNNLKMIIKKMRINLISTLDNSITHINYSIDQNNEKLKFIIDGFDDFLETGKMTPDASIFKSSKKPLHEHTVNELREMAKEKKVKGFSTMKKGELIEVLKKDINVK